MPAVRVTTRRYSFSVVRDADATYPNHAPVNSPPEAVPTILKNDRRSMVFTCRFSIVTSDAILCSVILPVTSQAGPHIMADHRLNHSHAGDVSMAGLAFDLGPNMRSMLEFLCRAGFETVDPLPRNLPFLFGVGEDLLNPRTFVEEFRVAQHALPDRGNTCLRAGVDIAVTIDALQAPEDMFVMREFNRLRCLRSGHADRQHQEWGKPGRHLRASHDERP